MLPVTVGQIMDVEKRCHRMVKKRLVLSAVGNLVPIPGVDIAIDVGLLVQVLSAINREFSLSGEQIEELDTVSKEIMYSLIVASSTGLIGKVITKQLVMQVLKKIGLRYTAKEVTRFVPIIGQVAACAVSVITMKKMCDDHIKHCKKILTKYAERRGQA